MEAPTSLERGVPDLCVDVCRCPEVALECEEGSPDPGEMRNGRFRFEHLSQLVGNSELRG